MILLALMAVACLAVPLIAGAFVAWVDRRMAHLARPTPLPTVRRKQPQLPLFDSGDSTLSTELDEMFGGGE